MSKPKWEKAPEWARVIVQQGVKKPHYCWAADHEDGARALWVSDTGRKGLDLDKDILIYGNKEYGPDTCVFVPKYINNILVHSKNVLNGYPVGVYYLKQGPNMVNPLKKPFMSEMDKKSLGTYLTPMEAHKAWQEAKANKIFSSVNRYSAEKFFDTRVADALLSKAWKLKTDAQLGIETVRL